MRPNVREDSRGFRKNWFRLRENNREEVLSSTLIETETERKARLFLRGSFRVCHSFSYDFSRIRFRGLCAALSRLPFRTRERAHISSMRYALAVAMKYASRREITKFRNSAVAEYPTCGSRTCDTKT